MIYNLFADSNDTSHNNNPVISLDSAIDLCRELTMGHVDYLGSSVSKGMLEGMGSISLKYVSSFRWT